MKNTTVVGLYAGMVGAFGPKGQLSAINKAPIEVAEVTELGIEQDKQADKRVHGGPEKAIHQYALSSYEKLSKYRPLQHKLFVPGSIGENLSAPYMDDGNVCIGDIYQIGAACIQVSAPRLPCWKIEHKYQISGLSTYIAKQGITGWYYRVLQPGMIEINEEIKLQERISDLSIRRLMQIVEGIKCDAEDTKQAMQAKGLDPDWVPRLERKLALRQASQPEDYSL